MREPEHACSRRSALRRLAAGVLCASVLGTGAPSRAASTRERRTLLRGGLVVNASGIRQADVLVVGDKIAAIGAGLPGGRGIRTIDARGLQLLPGGIDPHVHLTPPFVDDFTTGSRAALAGGVTTVGAMAFANDGESIELMLERHANEVGATSIADVMLHPALGVPPRPQALEPIARAGHKAFKIFTIDGDFDRDFLQYAAVLEKAKALQLLPLFHCEDRLVLQDSQRRLAERGETSLRHYEQSRPALAEVLAVEKAIALCELTGSPIYIVHLSSARALEVCASARARGLPVHVETRPIYLHLTSERYQTPDAPLYVGMPPIRAADDSEALWRGLASGAIDTLGSDHAPWSRKEKLDPSHDITDPLAGMSNLQVMLPMLYSEGVLKGRLSLERFVAVTATNAARLFGLLPRKGVLEVGADADIAVWDPAKQWTLRAGDGFTREDFSVYEGWQGRGAPLMTLRRGQAVYENGRIAAPAGTGRLLCTGPCST